MSKSNQPLVSIGMPIYNAEECLALAVESLLAQDYPNFELIISDNASRDRTEEICREFRRRDPRIRYIRQRQNQGSPANFEFVAREARGEYFMWAAHDDLWHPSYVSRCLAKLQSTPSAVLACSEINFINAAGLPNEEWTAKNFKNTHTEGFTPEQRVHQLISVCGWFSIYGVMPVEVTRQLSLGLSVHGWDVVLILELLLMGDIVKVPEALFSYRFVKQKTAQDHQDAFNSESNPIAATKTPFAGLAADLLRTVYRSDLPLETKSAIFADFIATLTSANDYWRRQIEEELIGAAASLSDDQFADLLGLTLSRAIPLESFKDDPSLKRIFGAAVIEGEKPASSAKSVICSLQPALAHNGPRAAQGRAVQLLREGNAEEASEALKEALAQQESSDLWHSWAIARLACGETAEAESGFRRALQLNALNYPAALALGMLASARERADLALKYLSLALPLT
jgi:glycosyltransferase involved in cell wall biosynthesis